jgi:hypothetical protein
MRAPPFIRKLQQAPNMAEERGGIAV